MEHQQIPQAAGIVGLLTAAGLGSAEVHHWFGCPRVELAGLTPGVVLSLAEDLVPGARAAVIELAEQDAVALAAFLRDDTDRAAA